MKKYLYAIFLILTLASLDICGQELNGIISQEEEQVSKRVTLPSGKKANTDQFATIQKNIFIENLMPDKIFYKALETVKVKIKLKNPLETEQKIRLICETTQLLDTVGLVFDREFTLAPHTIQDIDFEFPAAGFKGGVTLTANAAIDSKIIETLSEYFAVGKTPFESGQYLVLGSTRGNAEKYQNTIIPDIRGTYINCIEWYSWSPDMFGDFIPTTQFWRSSQSKYPEGLEDARTLIRESHKHGIAVLTYAKSWSYGPIGFELALRNPELVIYDTWGHFSSDGMGTRDTVKELAYSSEGMDEVATIKWNFEQIQAVSMGTNAWLKGAEYFGYDGVRFDGHYLAPRNSEFDVFGKSCFRNTAERDTIGMRNIKYMRQLVEEKYSEFLYGFNYGEPYAKSGIYNPATYKTAAENSMIMWESAQEYAWTGMSWKRYYNAFKQEASIVAASNGHMYGIVIEGSPVFNAYAAAFAIASRGHISSMKKGMRPWYRFATRNCDFIYDPAWNDATSEKDIIQITGQQKPIWKPFVYKRDLKNGKYQYAIHMINQPNDRIDKQATEFPSPMNSANINLKIPQGMFLENLYWTQAGETLEHWQKLEYNNDKNNMTFNIPPLNVWGILILEMKKQTPHAVSNSDIQ